jgi:hypothetical protein
MGSYAASLFVNVFIFRGYSLSYSIQPSVDCHSLLCHYLSSSEFLFEGGVGEVSNFHSVLLSRITLVVILVS